jgi:alkanesulfonate monooxygenase SsuD/methylene tetrahydromethanopterin reductase-like flavin-dependent oxidoreductase (luciferase family)
MVPPPQRPIPLLGVGTSAPAIRRAARLDGWYGPPSIGLDEALAARARIEQVRKVHRTSGHDFTYYVRLAGDATPANVRRYANAGFESIVVSAPIRSAATLAEAIGRVGKLAAAVGL